LGFAGERLPECRRIDDRNALDLAEAEKVGVAADDVVGAAGDRALEKLASVGSRLIRIITFGRMRTP
jgi:hypothetical protein